MLGFPEAAASTLESLLCLQLKLSYLSTQTPKSLREYTHSRVRRRQGGSAIDGQAGAEPLAGPCSARECLADPSSSTDARGFADSLCRCRSRFGEDVSRRQVDTRQVQLLLFFSYCVLRFSCLCRSRGFSKNASFETTGTGQTFRRPRTFPSVS